ncbi:MAG: hypothetical protein K1000chlam1_01372 [Candidatus Anoxychlamydiales bacterium]|nr:hypothetical protein [Candidatus Anoxychlamydiales bacterium]
MANSLSINSDRVFNADRSLIAGFVDNRLIKRDLEIEESMATQTLRRSLQVAGIAISGLGKVPFIPINLKLKSLQDFRVVLAAGNTLGFWALGSWSALNIIDEIYGPLTPEEKRLFSDRVNCLSKTASVASSVILSVTSQAVIAYLAYTYNNNNILMPIAIMASDTSFPFYSTLLSARKVFQKQSFSEFEKKLNQMKLEMMNLIEGNRKIFVEMQKEEKIDYLDAFEKIKDKEAKKDRLEEYLPLVFKECSISKQSKVQKFGRTFFGVNGGHFTLNHLALLGIVAYTGGNLITSSSMGGSIAAALTILSTMYLEGTSMVKTSQRFFDGIYDFITSRKNPTLSEQLSPKLTFSLKAIGLLISVLAWGPSVEVAHDYIDQFAFRTYMQIASSLAVTLLISTAILDIIDQVVEKKITISGSKEDRTILEINKKMKRLARVIKKSPLIEFAKFIKVIPQDLLANIQKRCKIASSELDGYISEQDQNFEEGLPLLV